MRTSERIAIVGATGVVGREALAILEVRGVPPERLIALASDRSAGGSIPYATQDLRVHAAHPGSFAGVGLAIFCATSELARELVPHARHAGTFVIDNSSAFRQDPSVPLVVPEVNGDLLADHPGLVANPNCSTVILLMALEPLRRRFGVSAIHVSTYQAVSGAGQAGIDELEAQVRAFANGENVRPQFFREPCAFNVFSHNSAVELGSGLNEEERKIIEESRKIWRDPSLRVTPACFRVPVLRAHTQAITVELREPATEAEVRLALATGDGIRVLDGRGANDFPTPLKAAGSDEVLVGRVRPDPGSTGGDGDRLQRWCLMACGDQLRKGAALNAIQIAERLGLVPAIRPQERARNGPLALFELASLP